MPVPLAIKLQAGTKEFYQLNELTKNNPFHRAGNSITKVVRKSGKKTERGRGSEGQLQTDRGQSERYRGERQMDSQTDGHLDRMIIRLTKRLFSCL